MTMSITSLKELSQKFTLTENELRWKEDRTSVPLLITDYYLSLIDNDDPSDPLRIQSFPSCLENESMSLETIDPLEEVKNSRTSRLVHRYSNRVAFLATDLCFQYCRHCFRRRFTGNLEGKATEEQVLEAASYLKSHPEIREMLFTGGDVLTLSDDEIDFMIGSFRKARPDLIIRICTRTCAVLPSRVTDKLIGIFRKHKSAPFYLMTQFNHPRELTKEAVNAVSMFVDSGIPAMNQSVLLRGVNDDADTLEELCNTLLFNRIKPYYLFQGDLVSGTSCYRVPLQKGLELEKELRRRLSGLAMPSYTADLPEGGGKVPLCGSYIEGFENGVWHFRTTEGQTRLYPDPKD